MRMRPAPATGRTDRRAAVTPPARPVPSPRTAVWQLGYIVLSRTEQQPDGMIGTIERDFAAGLGLVREHTVVQIGPITALRQDVVLAGER